MKFSVFSASTPEWTPAEAVATLAAHGWDGIEWRVTDQQQAASPSFWAGNRATWPLTGLEESIDWISQITRGAGLEISGIGGYARCDNLPDVERLLAATARLDADQVRIVTLPLGTVGWDGQLPSARHYRDLFDEARRSFEVISRKAETYGVKALIELHHGTIAASASAAYRLVEGFDPRHIGVIHDMGNVIIEGYEDYLSSFELLGEYLAHIHVKNVVWRSSHNDGVVSWRHEWAPLRVGLGELNAYFAALYRVGYSGWVTVEDFSTELPLEARSRDNLAFLKSTEADAISGAR